LHNLVHGEGDPDLGADERQLYERVLLRDQPRREALARSAQQRVYDEFLILTQIRHWLELISDDLKMRHDGEPRVSGER
jgi:hypothetical protein